MKYKRRIFWTLLILSLGTAVWWATHVPYDPARLYRAVPSHAWWVSEHEAPARRWRDAAGTPLAKALLETFGVAPSEVDRAIRKEGLTRLMDRLARRKVIVAAVPALGRSPEPAWVMASWVGGYGQLLRWGLAAPFLKDLQRIQLEDGWRGWLWDDPETLGDRVLSAAVVDGILVACLSPDPHGVQVLIDRLQRGAVMIDELKVRADGADARDPADAAPDRVWIRWLEQTRDGARRRSVQIAATELADSGWDGWITGDLVGAGMLTSMPDLEPREPAVNLDARVGSLEALLGSAPDAVAVMPAARGRQWMRLSEAPGPVLESADFLFDRTEPNGLGFIALFSGPYSGRLLGLKIPSLMAGVAVDDEQDVMQQVSAALDRLNASRGWGLIPRPVTVEGVNAVVIDSSRGGVYGSLSDDERAVFAVVDGWLTACSSMRTLRRLLRDRDERVPSGGGSKATRWPAGVRRAGGDEYVWLSPGAAGTALKKVLAAYSLVLMVQQSNGHAELRERLELLRTSVEHLAPIQSAELWVARDRPEPALRFRLSTEPSS